MDDFEQYFGITPNRSLEAHSNKQTPDGKKVSDEWSLFNSAYASSVPQEAEPTVSVGVSYRETHLSLRNFFKLLQPTQPDENLISSFCLDEIIADYRPEQLEPGKFSQANKVMTSMESSVRFEFGLALYLLEPCVGDGMRREGGSLIVRNNILQDLVSEMSTCKSSDKNNSEYLAQIVQSYRVKYRPHY